MGWQGAVLILIPTVNTKAEPSEMFEWELRVQAFQNSVMPAMCNRVGAEDEMHFSGKSIVVDAQGNVITKADDTEQIVYVDAERWYILWQLQKVQMLRQEFNQK